MEKTVEEISIILNILKRVPEPALRFLAEDPRACACLVEELQKLMLEGDRVALQAYQKSRRHRKGP